MASQQLQISKVAGSLVSEIREVERRMVKDALGHVLCGATPESAQHFDDAVRALGLSYGDPIAALDKACLVAPRFKLAHLCKAWLLAIANDPALTDAARAILEGTVEFECNDRERAHELALRQAIAGNRMSASAILDRHTIIYPLDLLAHLCALYMDAFGGRFQWVAERTVRSLPQWSRSQSGYDIMLGIQAMGLEEVGDYSRALDLAECAIELEPFGYWAHHALLHVFEMTGRWEDGLRWAASREQFWSTPKNGSRTHVWWHKSLFHLELGQMDEALMVYDGPILATQKPIALSLTNASSLLWRLNLLGRDTSDRWARLAELWENHADGRFSVFTDIHAAMADLGAGRLVSFDQRLKIMRTTAVNGTEASPGYRHIGLPAVEGLAAFHRGHYRQAVELLLPARFDLWKMGGSKAQQDVISWTLAEAAVRSGQREIAHALAHVRLFDRPESVPNRNLLKRAGTLAAV